MKKCFSLLLLLSMGLCWAGEQDDDLQNDIAAAKKLLREIHDDNTENIRSSGRVASLRKMHELQQLAAKIGLSDNSRPEEVERKAKDPESLCRFYDSELKYNPRFKKQTQITSKEQKEERKGYEKENGHGVDDGHPYQWMVPWNNSKLDW